MLGKLLKERYQIIQPLSSGTFGQTYIAIDIYETTKWSKCVVKHLKANNKDPLYLETLKHCFIRETEILKLLQNHPGIPKLLACFEEEAEFYIVQEFIEGNTLSSELAISTNYGQCWSEKQCIKVLQEVLSLLNFIHNQGVIHCDIDPNNLIRRNSDGTLFLLDFSAAQQFSKPDYQKSDAVISINSSLLRPEFFRVGYLAPEQLAGSPQPNSDIYGLGIIAITALSGLNPSQLKLHPRTNEIAWQQEGQVSNELASIINQMIRYDFNQRYQSAFDVLSALQNLPRKLKLVTASLNPTPVHNSSVKEHSYYQDRVSVVGLLPEDCLPMNYETSVCLEEAPEDENAIVLSSQDESWERRTALLNGVAAGMAVNTILVSMGIYSLHNALRPELETDVLSKAKQEYQAGDLEKAIATAKTIRANSDVFPEAQAAIVEWRSDWQKAEEKFNAAKIALNQNRFLDAINESRSVPNIHFWRLKVETVVEQAKVLMEVEAQQLLQKAYRQAEAKDFTTALQYLKQIPEETEIGKRVQTKLAEYTQKQQVRADYFLHKAYYSAEKRNFKDALQYLNQIPEGTNAYTKAQVKITEYQQKQNLLTGKRVVNRSINHAYSNPGERWQEVH